MGTQLFNPNDRLTGRDGGPYLDEVQAVRSEEIRAQKEGREPDYDNVPADAGIQLSTADQLLKAVDVNMPSKFHETGPEARRMFEAAAASDNDLKVRGEIPDLVFKTAEELDADGDVDNDAEDVYSPLDPNASPADGKVDVDHAVSDEDDEDDEDVNTLDLSGLSVPTPEPASYASIDSAYAPDGGNAPDNAEVIATNSENTEEGK